ncbi:hypothetical protein HPB47_016758 [Ixodes persulcatus]|uniref:Uncharacterized protein n=1 Tax=Ixodes persulcatus TaxID=34615 RepID=A0AC60QSI9_IXOPE|nr:hypothetical protein HPB47_016758 [Ixodes persulcatus]
MRSSPGAELEGMARSVHWDQTQGSLVLVSTSVAQVSPALVLPSFIRASLNLASTSSAEARAGESQNRNYHLENGRSKTRQVPAYQLIDGSRRWPYLDPAIAHEASKYEPQVDDVLLVTYPSSGTHWTKQIISLIFHRGESALNYVEFVRRGEKKLSRVERKDSFPFG